MLTMLIETDPQREHAHFGGHGDSGDLRRQGSISWTGYPREEPIPLNINLPEGLDDV